MEAWPKFLDEREAQMRAENLSRELRAFDGAGVHLRLNGCEVVSFASNDYLGFSNHPRVIEAARKAIAEFGAGSTASALICGHKRVHAELAAALAEFKGAEEAVIFPSGFQAALSALGALGGDGENTALILDKLAHASLIDGARLSGARTRFFAHNDLEECAALLEKESGRKCVVVVESLYSMDGDVAPLKELVALAESAGALLLIDEAHATGVLGASGRGALEAAGFSKLPEHVVAMGTLSKALGAQGGFICASGRICRAVISARAHMFSTALSPACAGAAMEALKLICETDARARMSENAKFVREAVSTEGLETPSTDGPIVPIIVGDEARALALSRTLLQRGLLVPAIRFPTVKRGAARLRISVSAAHTLAECEALVRVLREAR